MIDALWIACSGVDYARSEGDRPNVVIMTWLVDRHPCDDEPYVVDIRIDSMYGDGARIDGPEEA